jgi:Maltose-binding periplasmic proteins/domains
MKKIIAVLLAVLLVTTTVYGADKKPKAKKLTLKVWESEGPEKEFMLWAAAEFKKIPQYSKITIVYEPVGSVDARAKIELDGPAGVGADVFVAPHDHIGALVNGGHILPNTDPAFKTSFVDAAVTAATYKGTTYGFPLGIESVALFYNKDLIKEAPKTWAEVETFAKTWNNKAQNKYALVWAVADAYVDYCFMGGFGAPLFGPSGNDRKQHNINSANAITGLKYFQSLRKTILDVPSADMSGDFCNSSFVEGKAAMIITGPWKFKDYQKANLNFGVATLPVFPGQTNPPATFSGVRLAFVSAYTNYPEEAAAFAQFLCSKAALEKRFEITKQIPPRKDITINDPLSNGILQQAKFAQPMPTIPQMNTYWSAMGAAFANIWDGGDVKSQLDAAAAAMEAAK